MDIASIGGIALALLGILAGMMVEGGSITQITQPTAAMIVFGGTLGAVMLQFPMKIFLAALVLCSAVSVSFHHHWGLSHQQSGTALDHDGGHYAGLRPAGRLL